MRSTKAATAASASAIIFLVGCGSSSPTAPTPPPVPQVSGQFTGSYTTTRCTESGAAIGSGFCAGVPSGLMALTPQQSGSALTGTLAVGGTNIPVSGSVDTAGVVVLTGSGSLPLGATLTVSTWRGTLSGNSLIGTTQFTISSPQPLGVVNIDAAFLMTK